MVAAFYAAALRWEDLELDCPRPTIIIQHSADTRKQTRVSATKTGEERRVRIGPRMVEVLRRHRARQLEERMKASTFWAPPLLSGANQLAPSLLSALLMMAFVVAV